MKTLFSQEVSELLLIASVWFTVAKRLLFFSPSFGSSLSRRDPPRGNALQTPHSSGLGRAPPRVAQWSFSWACCNSWLEIFAYRYSEGNCPAQIKSGRHLKDGDRNKTGKKMMVAGFGDAGLSSFFLLLPPPIFFSFVNHKTCLQTVTLLDFFPHPGECKGSELTSGRCRWKQFYHCIGSGFSDIWKPNSLLSCRWTMWTFSFLAPDLL